MKAALILQDGTVFFGQAFGALTDRICETVFYTGMTGNAELITDPAFAGKAVAMTYPLAGNCGICAEDFLTGQPCIGALIVSEISEIPSNFRSEDSLPAVLERFAIPGIMGVDTRFLVRLLRAKGTMRAFVTSDTSKMSGEGLEKALAGLAAWAPPDPASLIRPRGEVYNPGREKTVALLDTGARRDTIAALTLRGVTVRSYGAAPDEILAGNPHGILLAEGPDGLHASGRLLDAVRRLYASGLPMLAVGQGHSLLAAALGAQVSALPCGHCGANYAVRNVSTGKVCITSQSTGFAVEAGSLPDGCSVTHINVNDRTVAGLEYRGGARSFAYNPGLCAGAPEFSDEINSFLARMGV